MRPEAKLARTVGVIVLNLALKTSPHTLGDENPADNPPRNYAPQVQIKEVLRRVTVPPEKAVLQREFFARCSPATPARSRPR